MVVVRRLPAFRQVRLDIEIFIQGHQAAEDIGIDIFSGQFDAIFPEPKCIEPRGESKSDYEVVCTIAEKFGLLEILADGAIVLSDPVSYVEMIALESEARLLLTDSGGVQKEAYFFGVPCVVVREETEWTELVEIGWNRLAGTQPAEILAAVDATLRADFARQPRIHFYGDGQASARIAEVLRWRA